MHITRSARIVGQPAIVIRDLLRALGEGAWGAEAVAARLGTTRRVAGTLIGRLRKDGYVQTDPTFGGRWFSITPKGTRLALASAAPQLKRGTAERQLKALLGRVQTVNLDPYYLYRVTKVVLFGSMLTTEPRVSDVDVAIEMQPKLDDVAQQQALEDERVLAARRAGRRFRNLVEEVWWPKHEVRLFLKARSRAISIHEADRVVEHTATRVVFDEVRARTKRSSSRLRALRPSAR